MRRKGFLILTAALLGWAAFAAAVEIHRTRWIVANDPWEEPSRWRFQSRHVEELRGFLDLARPHLPAGAVVGVVADPDAPRESFFRYLWIAYLLPDYELRHAGVEDPGAGAEYWIAYGGHLADPELEVVVETEAGGVYRPSPPGPLSQPTLTPSRERGRFVELPGSFVLEHLRPTLTPSRERGRG